MVRIVMVRIGRPNVLVEFIGTNCFRTIVTLAAVCDIKVRMTTTVRI